MQTQISDKNSIFRSNWTHLLLYGSHIALRVHRVLGLLHTLIGPAPSPISQYSDAEERKINRVFLYHKGFFC